MSLDATALLGGASQISGGSAAAEGIADDDADDEIADEDTAAEVSEAMSLDEIAESLSEAESADSYDATLEDSEAVDPTETAEEVTLDQDTQTADAGSGTVAAGQATDEAVEDSETDLDDRTVASLPVTIAKEDEDDALPTSGDSEECSSNEVETIALSYTEGNLMRRMGGLGVFLQSPFFNKILSGILSESSDDEGDGLVFLLPKSLSLDDADGEFSVETCQFTPDDDEDGAKYKWVALDAQELAGLELETGRVKLKAGRVSVSSDGSVLGFTGMASKFRLRAADFGTEDSTATPFLILR